MAADTPGLVLPLFPAEVLPPPRDPSREHRRARPSRYAPAPPPPCAPLPARIDCYRHPVVRTPQWQQAYDCCLRWIAATDPAEKRQAHDAFIAALRALDNTAVRR